MHRLDYIGSYLKYEIHRITIKGGGTTYDKSLLFGWHEAAKEGVYYALL
jgi:hypothetical protein